jgi:hypothetical protein
MLTHKSGSIAADFTKAKLIAQIKTDGWTTYLQGFFLYIVEMLYKLIANCWKKLTCEWHFHKIAAFLQIKNKDKYFST